MKQRKIVHIDCDCFYAAIEMRDDPSLAGKPLAVGGSPDKRGVVATCNYEARAYGLHSAMAMRTAMMIITTDMVIPMTGMTTDTTIITATNGTRRGSALPRS